jgi:hypothetical protein
VVLLAAVAHPDTAFRADLARRLRTAIDATAVHTDRACRAFFRRLDRSGRCGVHLGEVFRELAAHVIRLCFTRPANRRGRLHIAAGEGTGGYLVTSELRCIPLAGSPTARHRLHRLPADWKLDVGTARA